MLGAGHELRGERALGRQQEEGDAKERVRARGEDGDLGVGGGHAVLRGQREVDLGALGAADPVGLHRADALGPLALELLEVVEQLLGVVGDLEVPLGERALLGHRAAAPALAVHDLLVGKDSLAAGAPVHRRVVAVDEALLPHLEEDPLAPLVVLGVAGVEHAVVVIGEAHAAHGLGGLRDILVRPDARLRVVLDGGVLGGQAEGVVAHRVQHVEAAHAGLTRHGVADRVVARVAHVQVARGVREHLQHVLLGLLGALLGLVELLGVPLRLPAGLDLLGVVGRDLKALFGVAHLRCSFVAILQPCHCSSTPDKRGCPIPFSRFGFTKSRQGGPQQCANRRFLCTGVHMVQKVNPNRLSVWVHLSSSNRLRSHKTPVEMQS